MSVTSNIRVTGAEDPEPHYNNLTDWESDLPANLVTDGNGIHEAVCYDDWSSGLDDAPYITGFTSDSTNHIKITVAAGERHDGTDRGVGGTGFYLKKSSSEGEGIYLKNISHAHVEWVMVDCTNLTSYGIRGYNLGGDCTINHCIIYNINGYDYGISLIYGSAAYDIYRCIISSDESSSHGISVSGDTLVADIHNCTVDCGDEAYTEVGTATINVYNSIGHATYPFKGISGAGDYNIDTTSNTTYQAPSDAENSLHNETWDTNLVTNITSGSEDYHLPSGSNAIDEGYNYGSPYDVDIDGVSVTGTWDIGADEYVSAGAAAAPTSVIYGPLVGPFGGIV